MNKKFRIRKKRVFVDAWFNEPNQVVYRDSLMAYYKSQQQGKVAKLMDVLTPEIDESYAKSGLKYTMSDAAKQDYTTLGGTPHLDGGYTVFGEIIEGLEIIDLIAAVETSGANRPSVDVKMSIDLVKRKRGKKKKEKKAKVSKVKAEEKSATEKKEND